jgi:hypothetical protein
MKPLTENAELISEERAHGKTRAKVRVYAGPRYFEPAPGMFVPIQADRMTKSRTGYGEPMFLKAHNVVSVGIRESNNPSKFVGFRPADCPDGSEQLEVSLLEAIVGRIGKTSRLGQNQVLSKLAMDLGSCLVHATRRGCRLGYKVERRPFLRLDLAVRQLVGWALRRPIFRLTYQLHTTGLEAQYRADLDTWDFHSSRSGRLRFRLRPPRFLDFATCAPLQVAAGMVRHSFDPQTGIYIKEVGEKFDRKKLPSNYLIDLDLAYSTEADGFVTNSGPAILAANKLRASIDLDPIPDGTIDIYDRRQILGLPSPGTGWPVIQAAIAGTAVDDASASSPVAIEAILAGSTFTLNRAFTLIPLIGLTGSVQAASWFAFGDTNAGSPVGLQQGTQAAVLSVADFDAFAGVLFGTNASWAANAYNEIPLNAAGRAFVQSCLGTVAKFCSRNTSKDAASPTVAPDDASQVSGMVFADDVGAHDPYLELDLLMISRADWPGFHHHGYFAAPNWVFNFHGGGPFAGSGPIK